MADTQRTITAALALLADNTAGDISPQDLRDAFTTWRPGHGQIYVPAAAAAAITIVDTTNYVEVTAPAWTLSSGGYLFDESDGNGRLTYIGTESVMCHIACTISFTAASNNQLTHWRLGKNGTTDASSEVQRKGGTGSDVGAAALHLMVTLTTGDHISLFVRNATAVSDPTLTCANLQVLTAPV